MIIWLQDWRTSSYEQYYYALPLLENMINKLDEMESSTSLNLETSKQSFERQVKLSMEHIPQITICDPSQLRTKGHPKNVQRLNAWFEVTQAQTKTSMCSLCNESGHYFTCKISTKTKTIIPWNRIFWEDKILIWLYMLGNIFIIFFMHFVEKTRILILCSVIEWWW